MAAEQEKLNVDDIIASLQDLTNAERSKLQIALFELQNDLDLKEAIQTGLDDVRYGRVSAHEAIIKDIKAQYNC